MGESPSDGTALTGGGTVLTHLRCGNMNLLPKSSKEFGSADYWEKFFQQRGKKAFEWYGTYLELCGVLHKYIKPREKVSAAWQPCVCVCVCVCARARESGNCLPSNRAHGGQ